MATSEYHVEIQGHAVLTVEFDKTPITIHLTLPSGDSAKFEYLGDDGARVATVTKSSGAPFKPPPTGPVTIPGIPVPGHPVPMPRGKLLKGPNTLDYIDPQGSSMP